MIEDLELRTLFKVESDEHLQTLENGLLRLEADPKDTAIIEDLFRSAHSLKGAARMLGVADLETLAHHFEDQLSAARRGNRPISAEGADRLYHGLDAMRQLALEASTGKGAPVDLAEVLARLRGDAIPESTNKVSNPDDVAVALSDDIAQPLSARDASEAGLAVDLAVTDAFPPIPTATVPIVASNESPIASETTTFKVETMRVEPAKLDALMTLAGEMVVTTARTVRAMSAIEELGELWEEWNRDAARSSLALAGKDLPQRSPLIHEREAGRLKRLRHIVDRFERTSNEEVGRLSLLADDMIEAIRDIRLLPFSTIFNLFSRLVRDLSHEQGKEVRLEIEGGSLMADKHLLEELKDPLMHMIRNAVDHAVGLPEEREKQGKPREATIWLRAYRTSSRMVIEIADDGRGLDEGAIRRTASQKRLLDENEHASLSSEQLQNLIFSPGFSTTPLITDVSGRGVGLDVVRTNIDRLKGTISVQSQAGVGCVFRIEAPITLATIRVLLIQIAQRSYAIPIETVQETFIVSPDTIFAIEGQPSIRWESGPIRVVHLSDLLELPRDLQPNPKNKDRSIPGVLLAIGTERLALFVDALLDEQEVILKPFGGLLQRVRNILGSTILSTGEICMVLNPRDLMKSAQRHRISAPLSESTQEERKKVLLLAEDSITTRTQEKRILEGAGYEVVTAVDGSDAFSKLGTRLFDASLSIFIRGKRRDEDDRQLLVFVVLPNQFCQLQSCHVWHFDIGYNGVDVFPKPRGGSGADAIATEELVKKIRIVAGVRVHGRRPKTSTIPTIPRLSTQNPKIVNRSPRIIVIGSSTGGPQALQTILSGLPQNFAVPIVCVQHISLGFLPGLVSWLSGHFRGKVQIAGSNEVPRAGNVYFPQENTHLVIDDQGRLQASHEAAVGGHRPSVSTAFWSAAERFGDAAIGVLLTGMGRDGGDGMLGLSQAGALTICQDEATCIVYGMPKDAVERGAARMVLPVNDIARALVIAASPAQAIIGEKK